MSHAPLLSQMQMILITDYELQAVTTLQILLVTKEYIGTSNVGFSTGCYPVLAVATAVPQGKHVGSTTFLLRRVFFTYLYPVTTLEP